MIERREMMKLTGGAFAAAALPAAAERRAARPTVDPSGPDTEPPTANRASDVGNPQRSNIPATSLANRLAAMSVPAGTDMIATSGFSVKGLGHAWYKLLDPVSDPAAYSALSTPNTVQASGQGIWWFEMADSRRAVLSEPEPDAAAFGAIGDAVYDATTGLWSGTDNTSALQSWLDYCTYVGKCRGRIGPGAFLHKATLHGGYGDKFVTTNIVGAGPRYGGESNFTGTALVNNFSDRPAVNYAGQRNGSFKAIALIGSFFKYILESNVASVLVAPSFDDTVMRNWLPPTADPRALNRYSTYAGFTVDAFNDNRGEIHGIDPETGRAYTTYDTPIWPAWTGLAAGRGTKALSSGLTVDADFRGFGAAWIVHPGNTDGNGDFIEIVRAGVDYCVYGGSYCQSQGRNNRIGYLRGGTTYCAITTNRHGTRNGRLGGTIESCSFSGLMRLMEIHTISIVTSTIFQQVYIEGGWQIGTCSGATSNEGEIVLAAPTIDLGLLDNHGRGVPPFVWGHPTNALGTAAGLRIQSGFITDFPYVLDFRTTNLRLDGVSIGSSRLGTNGPPTVPPFMAHVANATLGVTVPGLNGRRADHHFYAGIRNLSTGRFVGQFLVDTITQVMGTRDTGLPIWCRGTQPAGMAPFEIVTSLPNPGLLHPTSLTVSSDTTLLPGDLDPIRLRLEGNIGANNAALFHFQGGVAGSVIRHDKSGTVFAIYHYDSATGAFKARALNNYRLVSGQYQFFDGMVMGATDAFSCYYSGFSTPTLPSFASFMGGSARVTAFQRGTGLPLDASEVADGDRIFVNPNIDTHLLYTQNLISTLDLRAKTLELAAGAAGSAAHQRVYGLLRAPPANL